LAHEFDSSPLGLSPFVLHSVRVLICISVAGSRGVERKGTGPGGFESGGLRESTPPHLARMHNKVHKNPRHRRSDLIPRAFLQKPSILLHTIDRTDSPRPSDDFKPHLRVHGRDGKEGLNTLNYGTAAQSGG